MVQVMKRLGMIKNYGYPCTFNHSSLRLNTVNGSYIDCSVMNKNETTYENICKNVLN